MDGANELLGLYIGREAIRLEGLFSHRSSSARIARFRIRTVAFPRPSSLTYAKRRTAKDASRTPSRLN